MDGIQLALTEAERLLQETTKKREENVAMARRLHEEEEIAQLAKENLQQVYSKDKIYLIFSSDNLITFIIFLTPLSSSLFLWW